ncbi:MAG TPA: excinuclease ABC subunit UvrA [bacterium]|nr:excinuclease ABC subunit UvrA [bacterium]
MKNHDYLVIRGAREHNLKNINLDIPRNQLVVITGLSGSGKSSLAFDTIYAEGQRRYVESLSAYARQFLGLMEKPDVDVIEGLSPAISIEQRTAGKNPRSTVGTVTEIYDHLRLLYARIGIPYCYQCGRRIEKQTVEQMVDSILQMEEGSRIMILAPLIRGRKGEYRDVFEQIRRDGYLRIRVDGKLMDVDQPVRLDKQKKHTIEVVVDRLIVNSTIVSRLTDSLETAMNLSGGVVLVHIIDREERLYSANFACVHCNISYEEPSPRMFSFNSPYGACPTCNGLGTIMKIDPDLVVPDKTKSINEGAVIPWGELREGWYFSRLQTLAKTCGFDLDTPFQDMEPEHQKLILEGSGGREFRFNYQSADRKASGVFINAFEGIVQNLERRYHQTHSQYIRNWIEGFMNVLTCPDCKGSRLKKESLAVRVHEKNIYDITRLSIRDVSAFFQKLTLNKREQTIAHQILKEINARLRFLSDVGLDYLSLDRATGTLSGGEAQRIRLATQIGSRLVGVLYILDEPSIGLHQRDNRRLIDTLYALRDLGNTVLVVEHDRATIQAADWVIDLGPGAGDHGGQVVASGAPDRIASHPSSITGHYLAGKQQIPVPENRRSFEKKLILLGARGNNLKSIDVRIPLGIFVCVTGVSGSGKSTLINETLFPLLQRHFHRSKAVPLPCDGLEGIEHIDKVIDIDQSPIGRTPRSNPATYTGVFTHIRNLFSRLPDSKIRGYKPGRFSFNVKGGRCEACEGDGIIKIEMHFLPDVYVPCEICKGKRYNRETLEVKYRGYSIADILDMTVEEAFRFFDRIPAIRRKLQTLTDVGLSYIHLGQPATTLSGGEAQRVKLSTELSRMSTGKTFYILDEPTTGLHFEDIKMLLTVLNSLVNKGNTVVVIEHNLDVIKTADWIIDLGPEGGDGGGRLVAEGPPESVMKEAASYTGRFLESELN